VSEQAEELALFRDMVVRFLDKEVAPQYDRWEKKPSDRS
jgi:hypothetical protein